MWRKIPIYTHLISLQSVLCIFTLFIRVYVTCNDISVIYVAAQMCRRHRHRTTLFIRWFRHTDPFSRLYDTLGIQRTYSRLLCILTIRKGSGLIGVSTPKTKRKLHHVRSIIIIIRYHFISALFNAIFDFDVSFAIQSFQQFLNFQPRQPLKNKKN